MTNQNATHYDFFVSGKWRNRDNILKLTQKIRKKGYLVYCFLETSDVLNSDPDEHMKQFETRDWRTDTFTREIFEKDINAEKKSDTFILLLPAGKSCHIEAGVAYGMKKKCILIGEQKEAESLYLIFDEVFDSTETFLNSI